MTVVDVLYLMANNMTGSVPDSIANISTLTVLYIGYACSNCYIYGTVPSTIGNLVKLTDLELYNGFSGRLPNTICNLKSLKIFNMQNLNVSGSVPLCIFKNNIHLQNLKISNTSLSGFMKNYISNYSHSMSDVSILNNPYLFITLQDIIGDCSNLLSNCHNLVNIWLEGNIYGTITAANKFSPMMFILQNTQINGSIPDSLCNWTYLSGLVINNNQQLTGGIPNCETYFAGLTIVEFSNNTALSGTVPNWIFCNAIEPLQYAVIINDNINMDETTIPSDCLSKYMYYNYKCSAVDVTKPGILTLDLHNNKFNGKISEILSIPGHQICIEHIILHDNNFEEDDISAWLNNVFLSAKHLKTLSLRSNAKINGKLPNFDGLVINTNIEYFLIDSCNIYGTVPSSFTFGTQLKFISLYNNRLSCKVPESYVNVNSSFELQSLIICRNLFECDENGQFPQWVTSLYKTATNLYVTMFDNIDSIILFIISVIIVISVIVRRTKIVLKKTQHESSDQFITDIRLLQLKFSDNKLFVSILLLLVLYPISSNYFECTPLITWFSVSWFYTNDINSWNNWIFGILSVFVNICFCNNIYVLCCIAKQIHPKQSLINVSTDATGVINSANYVRNDGNTYKTVTNILQLFIYLFLYLTGVFMIILYLFCESLPDDNTLIPSSSIRMFISKSISIALAILNAFVVPRLFDSIEMFAHFMKPYRHQVLLLLRTLNTLIIPIITSIIVLNDCGRYWTAYWTPCNSNTESNFDLSIHIKESDAIIPVLNVQLLEENDVCSRSNALSIDWNKCIRSFFYRWTYVIMTKFIILIFMPVFVIVWKLFKNKLTNWYYERRKQLDKCKSNTINVDMEYMMLISNFESVLAFSIITPLILPITFIAVESNIYFYEYMINKLKWRLTFYRNIYVSFPIRLLIIGLLFEQLLISSFIIFCFNNLYLSYSVIICFGLMDTCFIIKYWSQKR
eukprot:239049_1